MPMKMRTPMPSLDGITKWINGNPPDTKDKVTVIHFWSISCHTCHEMADSLKTWIDVFGPQGVQFISIHQPRGPQELDFSAVEKDIAEIGFTQPVGVDNNHAVVERFENQYVPAYYVFDKTGVMRHFQAGDKAYNRIEDAIKRCLAE